MLKDIIDILKKCPDGKLFLNEAIEIDDGCFIWGLWGNGEQGLYLMMQNREWHQLEETDHNYSLVAKAVLNKLRPSYADAYGDAI